MLSKKFKVKDLEMVDYSHVMSREDLLKIADFITEVHAALDDLLDSADTYVYGTPYTYVDYKERHNGESPLDNLRIFGETMREMANENQSNVGRSDSGDQSEVSNETRNRA
jgi:hypothetical protein